MHVAHLSLRDFRSYPEAEVELGPGVTSFVGPNGQGKTNLVEAVDYVATLASHRVATDAPLVRAGAERAVVRTRVVREGREALVELELVPGATNRARVNRAPVPRAREVLGLLRTVLFSPEDLALVKGDPGERRRFLDQLLVARTPRLATVRADYDRVLRQRTTLLKSAGGARRAQAGLATLDVWDDHLARAGAELLAERLRLVAALAPPVAARYAEVAEAAPDHRRAATLEYQASLPLPEAAHQCAPGPALPSVEALRESLLAEMARRRDDELDRGVTLVGPHRDELRLGIGDLPARGYASHGESWSLALALRLGAYDLLRADGDDPVLVLDDVFAELDEGRRDRLARAVTTAEQVLVTAAVPADLPVGLDGTRYFVTDGEVRRVH